MAANFTLKIGSGLGIPARRQRVLVIVQDPNSGIAHMLIHNINECCDRAVTGSIERVGGSIISEIDGELYILIKMTVLRKSHQLKSAPGVICSRQVFIFKDLPEFIWCN